MKRAEPRYPGGGGGPSMSGAGGGYGGGSKNYGQGFNQGQFKLQCTKAAFWGWIANAVHTQLFQTGSESLL